MTIPEGSEVMKRDLASIKPTSCSTHAATLEQELYEATEGPGIMLGSSAADPTL